MDEEFSCDYCNRIFTQKGSLIRHYDRCNVVKYKQANLKNDDKRKDMNVLQIKLDEANNVIKEQQKSIEILQLKLG